MYSMSLCGGGRYTSEVLVRHLSAIYQPGVNPEVFAAMAEIEHIEARGIRYSNQDGDVLGHAWDIITRHYMNQRALGADVSAQLAELGCDETAEHYAGRTK